MSNTTVPAEKPEDQATQRVQRSKLRSPLSSWSWWGMAIRFWSVTLMWLMTWNGSDYHIVALGEWIYHSFEWPYWVLWLAMLAFIWGGPLYFTFHVMKRSLPIIARVAIIGPIVVILIALSTSGWLTHDTQGYWPWVLMGCVGFLNGAGMIASRVYRRITGRMPVEDKDTTAEHDEHL